MSSTTIFNIDIPVWDYMTGHEWEQVETLLSDPPASAFRTDLSVLKIFIESRTGETLDVDDAMTQPVPGDDVAEAVERLTAPFVQARRRRAERQLRTQAHLLSSDQLKARRKELVTTLEVVDRILSEQDGAASKPSSSTTTQDSGSKAGSRGRSKKPSN